MGGRQKEHDSPTDHQLSIKGSRVGGGQGGKVFGVKSCTLHMGTVKIIKKDSN